MRVWHIHMAPVIAVDLENVRYDQCGYHEFHTVHRSDVQFRVKLPIKLFKNGSTEASLYIFL